MSLHVGWVSARNFYRSVDLLDSDYSFPDSVNFHLNSFLDVDDIKLVVNYDYANNSEDYVHRVSFLRERMGVTNIRPIG